MFKGIPNVQMREDLNEHCFKDSDGNVGVSMKAHMETRATVNWTDLPTVDRNVGVSLSGHVFKCIYVNDNSSEWAGPELHRWK